MKHGRRSGTTKRENPCGAPRAAAYLAVAVPRLKKEETVDQEEKGDPHLTIENILCEQTAKNQNQKRHIPAIVCPGGLFKIGHKSQKDASKSNNTVLYEIIEVLVMGIRTFPGKVGLTIGTILRVEFRLYIPGTDPQKTVLAHEFEGRRPNVNPVGLLPGIGIVIGAQLAVIIGRIQFGIRKIGW